MQGCNHKPIETPADVPRHMRSGFTLVELLVTVAVMAILVALAVPSFVSIINSNRLAAQANELVASLQLARTEAVRRNTRVLVCRSIDGSTCTTATGQGQWLTFIDANSSGTAQAGEILRASAIKAPVRASNTVSNISFRPDGLARNGAGGLLATAVTVCMATSQPAENQRVVSIASGSRISTTAVNGAGACP